MTRTLPVETAPPARRGMRPLTHLVGAGLLGILGAYVGTPAVIAGLFGGWGTLLGALAFVAAVISAAAVGLDIGTGPDRGGRAGSVLRGVVLGTGGSGTVAVLAFAAMRADLHHDVPVPLSYAAAALPFLVIAGLQWPGAVRITTAVITLATAAVIGIPQAREANQERREAAILTEVGTTARPWVTRVEGLEPRSPHTTGSGYIWSASVDASGAPVVQLLRMPDEVVPGGDPCGGPFYTPEGDFPLTSCTRIGDGRWLRASDPYWQQLVGQVDGTWLGATARPDVPEDVLADALDNARPMDDGEYEAWLDAVLPSPAPGY
jgi:hypothetical protein